MLNMILLFLLIMFIAALLGFGHVAATAGVVVKFLLLLFAVLLLVSLISSATHSA